MIEGVDQFCTEMKIDCQYVDSHGQSTVAFAFCRLAGFQALAGAEGDPFANALPAGCRPTRWLQAPASGVDEADRLGTDSPLYRMSSSSGKVLLISSTSLSPARQWLAPADWPAPVAAAQAPACLLRMNRH